MNDSKQSSAHNEPVDLELEYPWLTVETTPVVCCVCDGAHAHETRYRFRVNGHLFSVDRCVTDNHLYITPQYAGAYFESLYNHPSYYSGEDDMYGQPTSDERSATIASIRLNEIRERLPQLTSLLEIGSAAGHLLEAATQAEISRVVGVEFSTSAKQACAEKDLLVHLGTMHGEIPDLQNESFDAIASYSVLEHVPHPPTFLQQISKHLSDDGLLFLRVPIIDQHGPWISLLDHLWHFTDQSITAVCTKAGFEVIEHFPSGSYTSQKTQIKLNSWTYILKKHL